MIEILSRELFSDVQNHTKFSEDVQHHNKDLLKPSCFHVGGRFFLGGKMWSKVVKILPPKCRQSHNKRAVKTQMLSSWRRHYLQLTIFTPKTFSLLIVVQGTDLRSVSILTFLQNTKHFSFLGERVHFVNVVFKCIFYS